MWQMGTWLHPLIDARLNVVKLDCGRGGPGLLAGQIANSIVQAIYRAHTGTRRVQSWDFPPTLNLLMNSQGDVSPREGLVDVSLYLSTVEYHWHKARWWWVDVHEVMIFRFVDFCKSYGPLDLDFLQFLLWINSSYIYRRIWMTLGTKQDDDG
jgi:hypothetical protein